MKIVFVIVDREDRHDKDLFIHVHSELANREDVTFITKTLTDRPCFYQKESHPKVLDYDYINTFDVCITDAIFAYLSEDWNKIVIPKVVLIEDQHSVCMEHVKLCEEKFKFDYYLVRYRDAFYKNHPDISKDRIFWFPHSINPDIYKDYKEPKKYNCLMVGAINEAYPIRQKIDKIMTGKDIYTRHSLPHSAKQYPVGNDYATLINRSWISITCSATVNYPIMKFFEIPGCNSVLCSDITPEISELGFIPEHNMIAVPANLDNIYEYLQLRLMDKKNLAFISNNGYNLIHNNHTVKHRVDQLVGYLRMIL